MPKRKSPWIRPKTMNRIAATTTATIALIPSQSAVRMSPGLPARASRFSVRSEKFDDVIRATLPDRRPASGRIVRSKNGCWSSSSSRFFAVIEPSWVRRAWTGSTGALPASPKAMRMTAAAATAATMTGRRGIGLDLDVHDAADEDEADHHHEQAEAEDDDPGRQAADVDLRIPHRVEEARRGEEDEAGEAEGQEAHHVARQALLRRQRPDLALDPDSLADRERDRVEDLGKVAADLVLDVDRGGHQLEVVRADAPDHVLHGLVEGQAQVDLADDPGELGRDRRPRLADDELDRLEERRAGSQRGGDEGGRVRELLVEGAPPARLAATEPEAGDDEADDQAADEGDDRLERGHDEADDEEDRRHPDRRGRPDPEELGRLQLEVGPGDLAGKVRPEVALLDDAVEAGQGAALGEQLGEALGLLLLLGLLGPGCVALQPGGHARAAARRGDADGDEEDRHRGDGGDDDGHAVHRAQPFPDLVREPEEALGQVDALDFETVYELGADAGRLEATLDLAVEDAGLLEDEDVLHDDDITFHALDLGDVGDLAGAVLEARLVDDEIDRRGDLLPDGADREVDAGHEDHRLESREHVARGVGVAGRERAVVARIHGLEHVQGLARTTLPDDDPVGPHPEGVPDELPDRDRALALDVRRPGLEGHHVLLPELELGGVLDRHDPLVVRDEARQDVQGRRLAGAGAAGDEDVEARFDARPEELEHLGCRGPEADQVVHGEGGGRELPDRDHGTDERQGRDDRVDARAVGQTGVDHRRRLVDAAADRGDDPIDDPHDVVVVLEDGVRQLEFAGPLDVDLARAVDHDLRDRLVPKERLQRPEADDLVGDLLEHPDPLGPGAGGGPPR